MTLYQACNVLNIWPVAKIWAEVWFSSSYVDEKLVDNVVSVAKASFKQLAMIHHPDKGGESDNYVNIQNAYNVIKSATVNSFIDSLKEESNKINLEQVSTSIAC
jgi:hypothetical protein